MTDIEKEIKTIRQLASNIRKYGKESEKKSDEEITQYEYLIEDIHLLGCKDRVTMCRTEIPMILLEACVVTAPWIDGEAILKRNSIYKIINIIREHNEFKLLEGIE